MGCFVTIKFMHDAKVASKIAKAESMKQEEDKKEKQEGAWKEERESRHGLERVTVGRVIDGDTFETADGRRVRLVGVNTPESIIRTEEYGKEASSYTALKLEGKQVWMQKDVSDTDRYSRYLRIIWLEVPTNAMNENEMRTKMLNADLVLNGYAEPSTYIPDVKYSAYFLKFAREARDQHTGLYGGTTRFNRARFN
ncbi:thermonuclease family protein [Bacillus sp. V3B]|uniref:thermonuclease family protein n=1 Tax=Bacillus sp. V3B TaxID=2804915 RepID=UPI0028128AA1|nr:thermonuclease family protein [Bacillus sp. V3B]MCQ6276010.1 thermonuclease family protein [Bacillus sp. V3B]